MKRRSFAIAVCALLACALSGCAHESASIGIIGGADGPTSVFVTSSPSLFPLFAVIACAVIICLFHLIRRR